MPLGHRSTIWDPGGPHPTPQTSIHTPKTTQFALSTLNVGQVPSSCLKIVNDTHPFSHPTSTMSWGRRSTIWDPMGPHQIPQTTKATQFSLTILNVGKDPSCKYIFILDEVDCFCPFPGEISSNFKPWANPQCHMGKSKFRIVSNIWQSLFITHLFLDTFE